VAIGIVLLVAGCTSSSTPSVQPSTPPSTTVVPALPTETPAATMSAAASASAAPSTAPSRSPSAAPAAVWSRPRLVKAGKCDNLVATIDKASRYHVAARCKRGISYLVSSDGVTWTETAFDPPPRGRDTNPQLAVDGDTLYLAYTRYVDPDIGTGCGDGVYVRTRHLPEGTWSEARRVGLVGDCLGSFRAADGVLHMAVSTDDGGPFFYESQSGKTLTRIRIPKAWDASIRVGDDGRARIAYGTVAGIRYGRVDDGRLSSTKVVGSDETFMFSPMLVLGSRDVPYLMWYQSIDIGDHPGPLDGIYFGTDMRARWTSVRISRSIGGSEYSFTVDPSSGRIHAILVDASMIYYTSPTGKKWTHKRLPGTKNFEQAVIRRDPDSGELVVFGIKRTQGIYLLSKP
jgi:hypothetical protein